MNHDRRFANRTVAGKALGAKLLRAGYTDAVVLALPRGGVPVAAEVARILHAPLDLVMVRKIGVPFEPELAAGAVVDGSVPEIVVNDRIVASARVPRSYIEDEAKVQLAEIERRRQVYLAGRPREPLEGRTLILVDDGIATGASARAAIIALKRKAPKRLILAVPVAPRETVEELASLVDCVVCLDMPEPFYAIGFHYDDFRQVADDEVVRLLRLLDGQADG